MHAALANEDIRLVILEELALHDLIAACACCRSWRRALGLVTVVHLTSAAHCNVRLLRHCASARRVRAVISDDETSHPSTDQQYMARRVIWALTALPALEMLQLEAWHSQDSPAALTDIGTKLLMDVCQARMAGAFETLTFVDHGAHICEVSQILTRRRRLTEGAQHIDPHDVDDAAMEAAKNRCVCGSLFMRSGPITPLGSHVCAMPTRTTLEYVCNHGLCIPFVERVQNALACGAANILNSEHHSCSEPCFSAPCLYTEQRDSRREWSSLLAQAPNQLSFTYFDVLLLECYGIDDATEAEYIDAVNLFVSRGAIPSEPLRDAARSGRLTCVLQESACFRRWFLVQDTGKALDDEEEALVEWLAGRAGSTLVGR